MKTAVKLARPESCTCMELSFPDLGEEVVEIGTVTVDEEKKKLVELMQELKGVARSINQNYGQLRELFQPPRQQPAHNP